MGNVHVNGRGCVPRKLSLPEQVPGWTVPVGQSPATSAPGRRRPPLPLSSTPEPGGWLIFRTPYPTPANLREMMGPSGTPDVTPCPARKVLSLRPPTVPRLWGCLLLYLSTESDLAGHPGLTTLSSSRSRPLCRLPSFTSPCLS